MRGNGHVACGLAVGLVGSCLYQFNAIEIITFITVSEVFALFPDIDLPTSIVGTAVKPISKIINKTFGQRTITHSGLWLISLSLLFFSQYNANSVYLAMLFVCFPSNIGYINKRWYCMDMATI